MTKVNCLSWKTLLFVSVTILLFGCIANTEQGKYVGMEKWSGDLTIKLEPAKYADYISFETEDGSVSATAQEGNVLVIINFTIRDDGAYPGTITPKAFRLLQSGGNEKFERVLPETDRFPNGKTLLHGAEFTDAIVFEVPKASKNLQLILTHTDKQRARSLRQDALSSSKTYETTFDIGSPT